ncbi:galactonate dehydratase [Microbacterium testaceum]|uniref:Mandelate racemase/muconate lactonizing enzyme C-terminal domain-containing protein n=1 Tax=Microbacterium testaceum TaxID=2033 RepID=A0A147F8B0_MICTE|nr:galactonate dehydratase [Microbacterium testaceum]KTS12808.1 hypothetical protein RSA3_07725 [Microbacterium testaceum]
MRITRVSAHHLPDDSVLCRIETDDGLLGWGEATLEGRSDVVAAAVDAAGEALVGRDPLRIEDAWQSVARGSYYRGGPVLSSALAGIDNALWDHAGRRRDEPVHALLGGRVRESAAAYAWVRWESDADIAAASIRRLEEGYRAVKIAPLRQDDVGSPAGIHRVLSRVAAVREAVGPDVSVMVDLHGRATFASARSLLRELEPLHPLFVEEPLRPDIDASRWRALADVTALPLAAGERVHTRRDFLDLLRAGVTVLQPDVAHAGGISEARRIADLAQLWDAGLAPHCPLGPLALAASVAVSLTAPNFLIQEQSLDIHRLALPAWVTSAPALQTAEGAFVASAHPGLGVEIDDDLVRRLEPPRHPSRSPSWRAADGSFAEW